MLYEGFKKIMEKLNNELKSEFVGGIFVYELVIIKLVLWEYKFKKNLNKYLVCVFFKWILLRIYLLISS